MEAKIKTARPELLRLCDANLNRLKEGIRVIEDINRYVYNNQDNASALKDLRHLARVDHYGQLLAHRDIVNDVLKQSTEKEFERQDIETVLLANYKRAQEAARVLEEGYKLVEPAQAEIFKQIRYKLYELEKNNLA